jgi:hypothetical protein
LDRTSKVEFFPEAPADNYSRMVVNGEEVYFSAQGATFNAEDMDDVFDLKAVTPRREENVAVTKIMVAPGVDIGPVADELTARPGVRRVSVYTNQDSIGDGWARSYERLETDGPSTRVVRYANGPLGDPHGGHVFSRDASQYAWDPTVGEAVQAPPNPDAIGYGYLAAEDKLVAITDELEFQSGAYAAFVRGKNVEAFDEQDLIPAVKAWRRAIADGLPEAKKMNLRTSAGTHEFPSRTALNPAQPPMVAKVKSGQVIPRIRNDRARDIRGIPVDGAYRVGNSVEEISEEWYGEIDTTIGWFQERHADALDRWGLGKISVSPGLAGDAEQFALLEWRKSGSIVLSKTYWADPETFMRSLEYSRNMSGELSPRVPVSPGGIVAHEMGHVLHGAIRLAEGGLEKKSSDFDNRVIDLLGGPKVWQDRARREISLTAGQEVSELVAEAVSEVVYGNPSPLAQQVYDLVAETLDQKLKFRRGMAEAPPSAPTVKRAPAPSAVLEGSSPVTDPRFWGKGIEGMFPSNAPSTPAPFPSVGKHKHLQAYDKGLVEAAVANGEVSQIDPRTLHATQPSVTQDGVRHYLQNPDAVYADADQAGNQVPVIYRRAEGNGRVRNLILSGTHRAAAALAAGRPLSAIIVDGGWGPPR